MSLASINKVTILKDRAALLAQARAFFAKKGVLEVDVPILSQSASIDLHIDLITATCCGKRTYLHSSPEYGMKRLLAEGIGDIYQISHVFRDHEQGSRHTVEFMMAEWYRMGLTFHEMIEETVSFISLFLNPLHSKIEMFSYKEAFLRHVGFYPELVSERDALYAFEIEPHFEHDCLTVIIDFPPEQAALANLGKNGLAERFEIYYGGMELANGYHELIDPQEQRERLKVANEEREAHGKNRLPLDEQFIEALDRGLPDCCGVAVGFDRLMMLRHHLEEIREASCFFI